ncbi:MAG: hypothetical protein ACOYJJ_04550 [Anaerovoracaceae bacterium]|jgi:hypothetical protein
MFEKKTEIYKKKDRDTWLRIREVLKSEGFRGVRANHYFADVVANGGCGAKLDPRDFGAAGKVDREIYTIRVNASDRDRALDAIKKHGLVAVVDESVETDAAVKVKEKKARDREKL